MIENLLFAGSAAVFAASITGCILSGSLTSRALMYQRLVQIRALMKKENQLTKNKRKSFFERVIVPFMDHIIRQIAIVMPLNNAARERLNKQLMMAGSRFQAKEYTAMTLITVAALALSMPVIINFLNISLPYGLTMILGAYTGYAVRRFLLASTISKRKAAIESELPNLIDLLSVSVTSGLGFEQALAYVTERCQGVLVDEFKLLQQQLMMGRAKREAMNVLAERCEVDEVTTFVSSVLQAEEVGITMQNILNSQADSIRQSHKQKTEEKAAKIPVKILLPIVMFIFPVIFIVLLGPAIISVMETFGYSM